MLPLYLFVQDLLENEDFKLEEIFILSLVRDVATVMCCFFEDFKDGLQPIKKTGELELDIVSDPSLGVTKVLKKPLKKRY